MLSNHLQTPILLTNSSNQIVWRANYEAFGKAIINDDVDGNGVHITFNVRFPGQYYDSESNLSYNRNRYYSTELGRYITSDPIGLAGGINTYAYVNNNPLRYIDPTGLTETVAGYGSPSTTNSGPHGIGASGDGINPGIVSGSDGVTEHGGLEANTYCVVLCNNGDIVFSPIMTQDFYGPDAKEQYWKWLQELNKKYPPDTFCPGRR